MRQPVPLRLDGGLTLQWAGNRSPPNRAAQIQTGRSSMVRNLATRTPMGRNSMRTDPMGPKQIGWNRRVGYRTTSECERQCRYRNQRQACPKIPRLTRDNGIRSSPRLTGGAGRSRNRIARRCAEPGWCAAVLDERASRHVLRLRVSEEGSS